MYFIKNKTRIISLKKRNVIWNRRIPHEWNISRSRRETARQWRCPAEMQGLDHFASVTDTPRVRNARSRIEMRSLNGRN